MALSGTSLGFSTVWPEVFEGAAAGAMKARERALLATSKHCSCVSVGFAPAVKSGKSVHIDLSYGV